MLQHEGRMRAWRSHPPLLPVKVLEEVDGAIGMMLA